MGRRYRTTLASMLGLLLPLAAPWAGAAEHWSLTAQGGTGAPLTETSLALSDLTSTSSAVNIFLTTTEAARPAGELGTDGAVVTVTYVTPTTGLQSFSLSLSNRGPGGVLVPGSYSPAGNELRSDRASLFVGGSVASCVGSATEATGAFTLHEAEFVTGSIVRLRVDFEFRCAPHLPAVTGTFVYDNTDLGTGNFTLGGMVWLDRDRDGIRDEDDPPLPEATVRTLPLPPGAVPGEPVVVQPDYAVSVRDDGQYAQRRKAGSYYLMAEYPAGLLPTLANQGGDESRDSDAVLLNTGGSAGTTYSNFNILTLSASPTLQNFDLGFIDQRGYISGRLWIDADRDGVRDAGELPLVGVTVSALNSSDQVLSGAQTDADGRYLIEVTEGSHRLYIERLPAIQSGANLTETMRFTAANVGADNQDSDFDPVSRRSALFTVAGNSATTAGPDAGLLDDRARITGVVWADRNRNGIREIDELPLSGTISVALYDGNTAIFFTGANGDGRYEFAVATGTYRVRFTSSSSNFKPVPQNAGGNDAVDSDSDPATGFSAPFTVGVNNSVTVGPDAGFEPPRFGSVIGRLWTDLNGDGVRDASEPPIAGHFVQLRPNGALAALSVAVQSALTNAAGEYEFTNVLVGDAYTVEVAPPIGSVTMASPRAVNGANDSDFLSQEAPATPYVTRSFAMAEGQRYRFDLGLMFAGETRLRAADWFPLVQGSSWVYRGGPSGAMTTTVRNGTFPLNSAAATINLTDTTGDDEFYTNDTLGLRLHRQKGPDELGNPLDVIYVPPATLLPPQFAFDDGTASRGTFSNGLLTGFVSGIDPSTGRSVSANVPILVTARAQQPQMVTTPAGVFPAVPLLVTVADQSPDAETPSLETVWLANGIGPIAIGTPTFFTYTLESARIDVDGDGVMVLQDNCRTVANSNQLDGDNDGAGDACDLDVDGDEALNVADNCPLIANFDQADRDGDRLGDVCDGDGDNDGISDAYETAHGLDPANPGDALLDQDGDGYANLVEALENSNAALGTSVPAPNPNRAAIMLGSGPGGEGQGHLLAPLQSLAHGTRVTPAGAITPDFARNAELANYALASRDLRPAWCDVDGDGLDELVTGLGRGGGGWMEIRDDGEHGFAHLRWLRAGSWTQYNTANGETWPACGDVDGDGRDELVVGYGQGGGGWLFVLDDAAAGFVPLKIGSGAGWLQRVWAGYNSAQGDAYPAVGNLDGDAAAEVAIGGGQGNGGWVQVLDDATTGFRPITRTGGSWIQSSATAYNAVNGTTRPAICDLNGDTRGELVLAGGAGVQIMDSAGNFSPVAYTAAADGWLAAPRQSNFATLAIASCGNLYGDQKHELLIAGDGGGSFSVHGDASLRLTRISYGYVSDGTPSWSSDRPAIGGSLPVDSDGDGVFDAADVFPQSASESADSDGDGIGNNADTDDDNDGLSDVYESANGLNPEQASGRDGAAGDLDRDGLTNAEEMALGTWAGLSDSDSDGLDDSYEQLHAFNPLVANGASDTDGDGYSNVQEYQGNGDPRDAASLPLGPAVSSRKSSTVGQRRSPAGSSGSATQLGETPLRAGIRGFFGGRAMVRGAVRGVVELSGIGGILGASALHTVAMRRFAALATPKSTRRWRLCFAALLCVPLLGGCAVVAGGRCRGLGCGRRGRAGGRCSRRHGAHRRQDRRRRRRCGARQRREEKGRVTRSAGAILLRRDRPASSRCPGPGAADRHSCRVPWGSRSAALQW